MFRMDKDCLAFYIVDTELVLESDGEPRVKVEEAIHFSCIVQSIVCIASAHMQDTSFCSQGCPHNISHTNHQCLALLMVQLGREHYCSVHWCRWSYHHLDLVVGL